MMHRVMLPLLGLGGMVIAGALVARQAQPPVPVTSEAVAEPVRSPFAATVSGSGLVEASSENIPVGCAIGGVVERVHVEAGDRVAAGDPLFQIEGRNLQAQRVSRAAAVEEARAELARLEGLPWAPDLPPLRARVAEAEAQLADAHRERERNRALRESGGVSEDLFERSAFAAEAAAARLDSARAELARVEAGARSEDLAVARAALASAEAALATVDVELERLVVHAPIDGQVLATDVRPGQFAPAGIASPPLLVLGATDRLHVRVDIDENDAWRTAPGARARGFLRGNSTVSGDLEFVRIEPFVVPKRSLTGFGSERVDTRVLQVVFAFDPKEFPAYVGQLIDVRIEATR